MDFADLLNKKRDGLDWLRKRIMNHLDDEQELLPKGHKLLDLGKVIMDLRERHGNNIVATSTWIQVMDKLGLIEMDGAFRAGVIYGMMLERMHQELPEDEPLDFDQIISALSDSSNWLDDQDQDNKPQDDPGEPS